MAGELKHASVGSALAEAEWIAILAHVLNNQARGDLVMSNAAATGLIRLAKGAANTVLVMGANDPGWSATLADLTLVTPTIASLINAAHDHADAAGGGATLTAPTIASAVLNTAVSGSAVLDEDAMGSNSDTQLATQQSIKAYADALGGGKIVQIPALAVGSTGGPSTTSASYQDMNEMSVTLTTTKGGLIAFLFATVKTSAAGEPGVTALSLDGAGEVARGSTASDGSNRFGINTIFHVWTGVSNASHTIKGRYKSDGSATVTLEGTERSMFVMEFDD